MLRVIKMSKKKNGTPVKPHSAHLAVTLLKTEYYVCIPYKEIVSEQKISCVKWPWLPYGSDPALFKYQSILCEVEVRD